jgi:hypothetical protein
MKVLAETVANLLDESGGDSTPLIFQPCKSRNKNGDPPLKDYL